MIKLGWKSNLHLYNALHSKQELSHCMLHVHTELVEIKSPSIHIWWPDKQVHVHALYFYIVRPSTELMRYAVSLTSPGRWGQWHLLPPASACSLESEAVQWAHSGSPHHRLAGCQNGGTAAALSPSWTQWEGRPSPLRAPQPLSVQFGYGQLRESAGLLADWRELLKQFHESSITSISWYYDTQRGRRKRWRRQER